MEIHKAAGIIIKDRKLLVERSKGKEYFIAPGGSIESGETAKQALVRELREEFQITVKESSLTEFGVYTAPAAGQEKNTVVMEVFMVNSWKGNITASSEVEDIRWITSFVPPELKVGSIFAHEVLPRLKASGLID